MINLYGKYILFVIITFLASSCTTYINFYSKTHTTVSKNDQKIFRLDLSSQNLDALPESISTLKDLRMLNLSGNPNLDLEKELKKLSNPKNIEILTLDSLNLQRLPKSILKLSNLKQLSLANNPTLDVKQALDLITILPIEFLSLKGNRIEEIPQNIVKISSLKDLNLSYNKLRGDQNFELFGKLPKLYSLWVDHNELEVLPASIGKVDQIRFLYIDHNKLQELPKEMSAMKTWVVHAGYNQFKELPEIFTNMHSLFMVHINNNDITTIPDAYQKEKYPLAGLILDNNPINTKERTKAEILFKGFFLLSFEQK